MIIDISREIREDMIIYKNNEKNKPIITKVTSIDKNGSNSTKITIHSHIGTHVDVPYHVFEDGRKIDELPLDKFYGKCKVLDLTKLDKITKEDLEKWIIKKGDIILFKTKNSFSDKFDFNFVYLEKTGAQYLVDKKIKTVGIDSLGVERDQPEHEAHKFLLKAEIPIIEGLNLKGVEEGEYIICCFPLKINIDSSPVRAILIKE